MDLAVFAGADTSWTPLGWLFHAQSKISGVVRDMPSTARLFWRHGACHYENHKVTVESGGEAMAKLVRDLERAVSGLVLGGEVPVPPLLEVADDRTNATLGYSFLEHPDNVGWVTRAGEYLTMRATKDAAFEGDWIRQGALNHARVRVYEGEVSKFLELLTAGVHLTGGLPLRRTETLTLRYMNSAGGGLRNMVVWGGAVMMRCIGGKSFWKVGERKVWRMLPAALSRVVVVYLCVVVPFLEGLELACREGKGKTEFLFSKKVATETPKLVAPREMTEAVKEAMASHHAFPITVAAWRHIAIAFGRRFLRGDFAMEQVGMLEREGDEGDHEDEAMDLMSGHSSKVAELHYAREVDDSSKFDDFHNLAIRWH